MIEIAKKKKYGYTVRDKKGYPKIEKMTVKQARKRTSKNLKKGSTKKKTRQKEKYEISLKREQALAEKGWKVVRTKRYLDLPKKAVGKKGYPYAVLNKNKNYESFYTWKEKPTKKERLKKKSASKQEKYRKKVEKRIKKGKDIGWGW